MMHRNRKGYVYASGFTMIELILVIVIMAVALSVLAPRLGDLSDDAHNASVRQVAGAYATAVALARAQWVAQGSAGAMENLPGFGRGDINVSPQGWPVSVNGTTDPQALEQQDCIDLWQSLLQSNAPQIAAAPGDEVQYTASLEGESCLYRYVKSENGHFFRYDTKSGDIVTFLN